MDKQDLISEIFLIESEIEDVIQLFDCLIDEISNENIGNQLSTIRNNISISKSDLSRLKRNLI